MQNTFIKTLKAEFIKIKGSNILTLGIILGSILPFIFMITNGSDASYAINPVAKNTLYFKSLFDLLLEAMSGFFLPLLIIITASKIAQLDHKNKGWQLMETQPITKFSIFFSKFLILTYNVFRALLLFTIAVLVSGWIYTLFVDLNENYSMAIPWEHFAYVISRLFIASLAVVALQYVISVLISNFIWSLVLGFGMLLSQLFLENFNFNLRWFPYNILFVSGSHPDGGQLGTYLLKAEWLSLIYTVIFLFIGYNWYRFKGFINAFFKKPVRIISTLLVLIIGGSLSYYFVKTNTLEPIDKTVFKGTIESDHVIKSIYLKDEITEDTLLEITVTNKEFRAVYHQDLPADRYILQFDNYSQSQLFMGTNDSIQIAYSFLNGKADCNVTGTRITENTQEYNRGSWSYAGSRIENNIKLDEPEFFMKEIIMEYEDDLNDLESKVSIDNIVAREDFLNLSRNLIAVKHAQQWKDYLKKKELYYPKIKITPTEDITSLLAQINLENEALLKDDKYLEYISDELMKDSDSSKNTLDHIAALKKSSFKDKWLFTSLTSAIDYETKNSKRDSIFDKYKDGFSNSRYPELIGYAKNRLNQLNTGQPASDFKAIDVHGTIYSLSSFKDTAIMIDTWASWCAPCKYQEPFYVRKYEKYKNQNIIFISMNVDKQENKWGEDLVEMNQDILQLRAVNIDAFMASYDIYSIPRFILIGKDGKIIDASFTFPSDKNFDTLLELKLGINNL